MPGHVRDSGVFACQCARDGDRTRHLCGRGTWCREHRRAAFGERPCAGRCAFCVDLAIFGGAFLFEAAKHLRLVLAKTRPGVFACIIAGELSRVHADVDLIRLEFQKQCSIPLRIADFEPQALGRFADAGQVRDLRHGAARHDVCAAHQIDQTRAEALDRRDRLADRDTVGGTHVAQSAALKGPQSVHQPQIYIGNAGLHRDIVLRLGHNATSSAWIVDQSERASRRQSDRNWAKS
mmetsp:Transcript_24165/g.44947  ORF Transcript_24165/g.44947 Transcript_24165/m.44947 type:complete len:236 (-) Transcript_24165:145-852(-)